MAPSGPPADHLSVRDFDLPDIRLLDNDEGEVQVGDVQVGDILGADFIPLDFSDEEDESEAEEDDNEEDWSDPEGEDLGYRSTSEGEAEEEEEVDVDDDRFQPVWRYFPVPSPEPRAQPVERPEDLPPVCPRSEDSAPPASGLSSSTKRSREDSDTPQVSGKRQRKNCEDCDEEPRPSTSGTSSSMPRRYWPSSFQYQRRPDDSDSDED
ncbi:hypothetical protein ABVT39_018791 [Epinephelus coioides]